jgi:DNA-binding MarR family transcriptional regulator
LTALAQVGSKTIGPLADFLGVERTTLTPSTQLLEQRGLVASLGTADARQRALRVTPAGHELLVRALPLWQAVQSRLDTSESRPLGRMAADRGREERNR